MFSLHNHQQAQIEDAKKAFGSGVQNLLFTAATGSGKSVMASYMIKGAVSKDHRVWFVVPREQLLTQMSNTFNGFDIQHSFISAEMPYDSYSRAYVCTLQTLVKRLGRVHTPNFIVIDECFVAGTQISTPKGLVNIENMGTGDYVYNATGIGRVVAISKKQVYTTSIVRLDNGTQIECTGNHPFLSEQGWVRAEELVSGQVLVGLQNMPELWKTLSFSNNEKKKRNGRAARNGKTCQDEILLDILLKEDGERNVFGWGEGEGFSNTKEHRASTINSWWQWKAAHEARNNDKRNDGGRMGDAACCSDKNKKRKRIPNLLQNRLGASRKDDSDRGRWRKPRFLCKTGARHQEGRFSSFPRVESVEIKKSVCGKPVYNMEVEGHPSYFADGILVHNCHWGGESINTLIGYAREYRIKVLGLTATPARSDNFGMGDWYDNMVCGPSIRWLIENKFLSQYKLVRPDTLGRRGNQVTNHVETWAKYGNGLKTIVYARDVVHSKAVVQDFNKAGYRFAHMDAKTPSDERNRIINAFADGELDGISNVFLLTFGFDLASQVGRSVNVRCILDLAPTESLTAQMQKNGRALRYDDAGAAVIIDLAGNSMPESHGFPCAERDWVLDRSDVHRRDVEIRERILRTMHCKSCLMPSMIGPLNCPHCGSPFIADGKKIRIVDGQLVEFSPDELRQEVEVEKKQARIEQGKTKDKDGLIKQGIARGMTRWNAERWAEHVIRGRNAKKK